MTTLGKFRQLLTKLQRCNTETLYTDQLDVPAGRTSQTNQLDGPAGGTSWTDQFFIFEAFASLHIQRLLFQFVHCHYLWQLFATYGDF